MIKVRKICCICKKDFFPERFKQEKFCSEACKKKRVAERQANWYGKNKKVISAYFNKWYEEKKERQGVVRKEEDNFTGI